MVIILYFALIQKTVVAILDKLINPHWAQNLNWPYLPPGMEDDDHEDNIARSESSVPDKAMNYDFFYHMLEADENGRQPMTKVVTESDEQGTPIRTKTVPNLEFNHKSLSCLRRIAESGNEVFFYHFSCSDEGLMLEMSA